MPVWISLSGGGLRSSLIAAGAMRAFSEFNPSEDPPRTVVGASGGGYAASAVAMEYARIRKGHGNLKLVPDGDADGVAGEVCSTPRQAFKKATEAVYQRLGDRPGYFMACDSARGASLSSMLLGLLESVWTVMIFGVAVLVSLAQSVSYFALLAGGLTAVSSLPRALETASTTRSLAVALVCAALVGLVWISTMCMSKLGQLHAGRAQIRRLLAWALTAAAVLAAGKAIAPVSSSADASRWYGWGVVITCGLFALVWAVGQRVILGYMALLVRLAVFVHFFNGFVDRTQPEFRILGLVPARPESGELLRWVVLVCAIVRAARPLLDLFSERASPALYEWSVANMAHGNTPSEAAREHNSVRMSDLKPGSHAIEYVAAWTIMRWQRQRRRGADGAAATQFERFGTRSDLAFVDGQGVHVVDYRERADAPAASALQSSLYLDEGSPYRRSFVPTVPLAMAVSASAVSADYGDRGTRAATAAASAMIALSGLSWSRAILMPPPASLQTHPSPRCCSLSVLLSVAHTLVIRALWLIVAVVTAGSKASALQPGSSLLGFVLFLCVIEVLVTAGITAVTKSSEGSPSRLSSFLWDASLISAARLARAEQQLSVVTNASSCDGAFPSPLLCVDGALNEPLGAMAALGSIVRAGIPEDSKLFIVEGSDLAGTLKSLRTFMTQARVHFGAEFFVGGSDAETFIISRFSMGLAGSDSEDSASEPLALRLTMHVRGPDGQPRAIPVVYMRLRESRLPEQDRKAAQPRCSDALPSCSFMGGFPNTKTSMTQTFSRSLARVYLEQGASAMFWALTLTADGIIPSSEGTHAAINASSVGGLGANGGDGTAEQGIIPPADEPDAVLARFLALQRDAGRAWAQARPRTSCMGSCLRACLWGALLVALIACPLGIALSFLRQGQGNTRIVLLIVWISSTALSAACFAKVDHAPLRPCGTFVARKLAAMWCSPSAKVPSPSTVRPASPAVGQ